MTPDGDSLATGQRSMADPSIEYPLWPPLTGGCPETSTTAVQYPLEVAYDYDAVDPSLFATRSQTEGPRPSGSEESRASGMERWAPLLPPLTDGLGLGEGATPLVAAPGLADWAGLDGALLVKDESRNPTWSQKDRLNRLAVSAAVETDAAGVVASSSGNHGAAAAAYAARADLPCVVFTSPETPPAMQAFVRSYGAAVLAVEGWDARASAVDRLADEHGFHPVTSRTDVHTGHPFGPEGYKTIAYETYVQLGRRAPGTVLVPTAHAELLYGVWKGFRELAALDVADDTPAMVACEPSARGPLAAALGRGEAEADQPGADSAEAGEGDGAPGRDEVAVEVPAEPTAAHSIGATRSTLRGLRAVRESGGTAVGVTEAAFDSARDRLAKAGFWQETSGAAAVAGVRAALEAVGSVEEPVVCLATSSGFKDGDRWRAPVAEGEWSAVRSVLAAEYDLSL